jgi:G:T-mismatch repair DNA endonuclease (very short patch repair protein)
MIERQCPACDRFYLAEPRRLRFGRQTTCSRACSYSFRFSTRKQKPRFVCATCGVEFERSPSHVKSKHGGQFCSRACHYAGRATGATKRIVAAPYRISEAGREAWKTGALKTVAKRRQRDNYRKSDETRAKLSVATARALAKGKPYIVSKLEDKVAAQLDQLGVSYTRQHFFRDKAGRFAGVADFYIPSLSAVIEVNGSYWHADPIVFPTPNGMQRRCVARYERKLDLFRTLGIRVAEVWERAFKEDPSQAVLVAYSQLVSG